MTLSTVTYSYWCTDECVHGDQAEQAGILACICLMNAVPLVPPSSPLEPVEDFLTLQVYTLQ